MPLKLFISHSSRLDEDDEDSNDPQKNPNLKLLLDVIDDIKQTYGDTIEILVDKDKEGLPAGGDWEKRLNEWLAECHAAIILFSRRAADNSNWVKKEAVILNWRNEIDPDFKLLIPICIKGQTTPEDLEAGIFATLRLAKNQAIRHAETSAQIIDEIQKALGNKDSLQQFLQQTPFDQLEAVISELLIRNTAGNTLESIWQKIKGSDKPAWHPNSEIKFANALTRYLLRDSGECFSHFQLIIDKIRPKVPEDDAKQALECIRSLWVDAKAAGCIPHAKVHKKFLALNGKYIPNYTFRRYCERVWPLTDLYTTVPTTKTDEPGLLDEIRAKFRKHDPELTPDECDKKINEYSRQVVVLLPALDQNGKGSLDDGRMRTMLRNKYPNAIFIIGTGEKLPKTISSDIFLVEPELDIALEKKSKNAETQILEFLDDYYE